MKGFYRKTILLLLVVLTFGQSCLEPFEGNGWEVNFPNLGSSSSPKAVDLNEDGIKDIIIGAGAKEYTYTPQGVLALDGETGDILWEVEAHNQVVGTPIFHDFTEDGTPDVIIGGRSAVLYVIDGASGGIVWEYLSDLGDMNIITDTTLLNFYNPQLIEDANDDGVRDLIVPFGGYTKACPTCFERPPGRVMVLSGKDGRLIQEMKAPDGKEIYMSPIMATLGPEKETTILFGTGGEAIGGHLYSMLLDDFLEGKFENIRVLASDDKKGFIAPPNIQDITGDGQEDIIVNAVNGRVVVIDGQSFEVLWQYDLGEGYEGYAMSSIGEYREPGELLIFSTFGFGPWPYTEFTKNVILDAKDGSLVQSDSTGTFQYASPVAYDFTSDGIEDVLLAVNNPIKTKFEGGYSEVEFLGNELRVYDIKNNRVRSVRPHKIGTNLGSTPLITDLDNDGYIDVISCYMSDSQNFYSFSKMVVERVELKVKVGSPFNWNSYMGVQTNAISIN